MPDGRHRFRGRTWRGVTLVTVVTLGIVLVAGATAWWVAYESDRTSGAAVSAQDGTGLVPAANQQSDGLPAINEAAPPAFPPGTSVLLVGDSLAVGIADQLTASMPGREVVVEAEEGRNTGTSVALLADHAATSPSIWVVSLGTNDNPVEFAKNARALLDLAGRDRCVLWYDVHRAATDGEINPVLQRIQDTHANVQLLAWQQLADANPQWFSVDDIHPDAQGYQQRSQLATDGVAQVCTQ